MKKEKKKHRVWVNDEGIICFSLEEAIQENDIEKAIGEVEAILKKFQGQGRILVYTAYNFGSINFGPKLRKRFAERTKQIFKNPGFKKIAIFRGDVISRTITSFIIAASGIKDMRIFETEKEAVQWLKEP